MVLRRHNGNAPRNGAGPRPRVVVGPLAAFDMLKAAEAALATRDWHLLVVRASMHLASRDSSSSKV
jgi:hypothetical protein